MKITSTNRLLSNRLLYSNDLFSVAVPSSMTSP
ncbi:hypothetical protein TELCIR_22885 [Teladorsagia circumcincta]|uniref:Uncharacterized protein n=1 Tax=Teladorsagia circumcincta TaxID=45464 RepID=A0A2G9TCM7_TELCI|nr:hypothetical protein TELCIR_22885 [Teladorsagia circumcincta]